MEVAAAIIGVSEVAIRTTSKLWKLSNAWREAPEELHRLRDDLSRTQQFFDEVRHNSISATLSRSWNEESPTQGELRRLLLEGSRILEKIEDVVDKLTGDQGRLDKLGTLGKMRRILWMANAQKIAGLRKELGQIVSSTCRLLIALNVSVSTEIHASLRRSQTDIESKIGNHVWNSSEQITSQLGKAVKMSQHSIIAHMDARIESIENNLLETVKQSVIKEMTLHRQDAVFAYRHDHNRLQEKPPSAPWASLIQHVTPYNNRHISPDSKCRCECHSSSRYSWALASLRSALGFVTLSYAGRTSQKCYNPDCIDHHFQDHRNVHLVYHFPTWLVRIAVSVFVSSNLNGSPQLNIRIFNHLPGGQHRTLTIFMAIRRNDTDMVRKLLSTGRASVFDVIGIQMHPPLWIAMILRRTEIIRVLLQAGADPYHQMVAYNNRSPVRVAFEYSLTGDPSEAEIASLFPLSDYCYEEDYTPIHMAVTGHLQLDLASALRNPQYLADINSRSPDGHTPLIAATIKGDVAAVRLLIRAGADIHARSLEGVTPLHFACRNGHYEVIRLLLQAGADVHAQDRYDRVALIFAVSCATNTTNLINILTLLVRCGADVSYYEKKTGHSSVLDFACMRGTIESVRFLLENGAYVNHRDEDRNVPIFTTIEINRHEMAQCMLDHGADVTAVNNEGWTILHWLARDGDVKMLRLFTDRRMRGLNTAAKDNTGRTPLAFFSARVPPADAETVRAFDELLSSCEEEDVSDVDDDEEFVDAVENLDLEDVAEKTISFCCEKQGVREESSEKEEGGLKLHAPLVKT